MVKQTTLVLLLIVSLIGGILIGYFVCQYNKDDDGKSFLKERDIKSIFSINFDFRDSLQNDNPECLRSKTDTISLARANSITQTFQDSLSKSPLDPRNKLNRIISWPDSLHGWLVDARKMEHFLFNQQGEPHPQVSQILIEMAYNPICKRNTLVFTAVEDRGGSKYNRIHLLAKPYLGARAPSNNILEFVDPCKTCP